MKLSQCVGRHGVTRWWFGFAMAVAIGAQAADSAPPLIPAEDFVKPALMGEIKFSPDGKHFAALAESKGLMQLVVADAETQKGGSYNTGTDADIVWFRWLTNDIVAVRTGKRGVSQDELRWGDFQASYISLSGKARLSRSDSMYVLRRLPGSATDVIVARDAWLDVVDTTDGSIKRRLTDEAPVSGVYRWVLDKELNPRALLRRVSADRSYEVWWREQPKSAWRMLTRYRPGTERGFEPVAVDAEGELIVVSNLKNGRGELRRFDRATQKPGELLVGHPQADIEASDVLYALDHAEPAGVRTEGDIPQTLWFDEKREAVQQTVDQALPADRVNDLQFLPDGRVLVASRSPADPGTYYMFDPKARSLTEWARERPWLSPEKMGVTSTIRFKARDGLEIPAYLTVPRGREARNLPLIVWVHGGPHARDAYGYDPTVQFFANRGYAVLQVNFRGSTGFGDSFMAAGFKQWGRTMQDDLTDGVRALIAQGRVDPKRICIGGASYGGYAALMGVVREPDLFRCAIDYVGVTDLTLLVELPEADYNRWRDRESGVEMKARVGNPDDAAERKEMDANSPRLQASKIKAPVLMIYGTDDLRVPLRQGTAMRDALQAAGAKYEWKTYTGEGHGVGSVKNEVDVLRLMETFLSRNIGATGP